MSVILIISAAILFVFSLMLLIIGTVNLTNPNRKFSKRSNFVWLAALFMVLLISGRMLGVW